jgi:thiol:disulfide interchange protein DsbD
VRKTVIALGLVAVLAGSARAAIKGSADVVEVKPARTAVTAAAGQRARLDVKVDIARTWHLYAHGDSVFIGVDLVPDEDFPLADFRAVYPAGHEGEFFGEKVMMLEGKNVIEATALVPAGLEPGEHALGFHLTVQACDDKTCLAPAKVPVAMTLTIE